MTTQSSSPSYNTAAQNVVKQRIGGKSIQKKGSSGLKNAHSMQSIASYASVNGVGSG